MFKKNDKGFTLIEMLVVIAIIAVLVAIIIPTVTSATNKAAAATDAANLRSVLGALNSELAVGGKEVEDAVKAIDTPESKLVESCELHVLYTNPGFIEVYFVKGDAYYGLEYLADVAENNESSLSTEKTATGGTWYKAGVGEIGYVPGE